MNLASGGWSELHGVWVCFAVTTCGGENNRGCVLVSEQSCGSFGGYVLDGDYLWMMRKSIAAHVGECCMYVFCSLLYVCFFYNTIKNVWLWFGNFYVWILLEYKKYYCCCWWQRKMRYLQKGASSPLLVQPVGRPLHHISYRGKRREFLGDFFYYSFILQSFILFLFF